MVCESLSLQIDTDVSYFYNVHFKDLESRVEPSRMKARYYQHYLQVENVKICTAKYFTLKNVIVGLQRKNILTFFLLLQIQSCIMLTPMFPIVPELSGRLIIMAFAVAVKQNYDPCYNIWNMIVAIVFSVIEFLVNNIGNQRCVI